jgi:anaerobic magnesium-protoporphyrin IX monomethyl ester cyclase
MRRSHHVDVALVNPGNRAQIYQGLGSHFAAVEPPVWVGLIASFVRKQGYTVSILDANAEQLTADETARRIGELNPQLTAIVVYGHNPSASTQVMPAAAAICSAIKRNHPFLKVLMLGGHVAALPERTLREEAADFVCGGEGPWTVLDLLQAFTSTSRPNLRQVRDLLFWEGDVVARTAPAPLVTDLDAEMPGQAWDLLPMERYRAHNWHCFERITERQPYSALYTTLGCPFRCTFCCIQAPFKRGEQALGHREFTNSYRYWSPHAVIAEIDMLVTRYGVRNIKFADEMFVLNRRHVLSLCDLLIERRYDLNLWAYARVDTVGDGVAEKMREAGFTWLAFGIEAASEHVRADVDKGFDQKAIVKTLAAVRSAGISVVANYIFGLPEDDAASMQDTLAMACELNAEYANFYCTMAYPGSQLYATAIQEGWPLPSTWSGYSQHALDSLPLPTTHVTSRHVLQFRDAAFHQYFSRPEYLSMMSKKFGAATIAHIQDMTRHRLDRQVVDSEMNTVVLPPSCTQSPISLPMARGAV